MFCRSIIMFVIFIFFVPLPVRADPVCWMVFYGAELSEQDVQNVDWVMVDSLTVRPPTPQKKPLWIVYLSLGEVNQNQPEFLELSKVRVEKNPHWPEAWRVDVRASTWQDNILRRAREFKKQGYDGLFLDTVDVAAYLEDREPQKFAGSKKAIVDLVRLLKKEFAEGVVVLNGGIGLVSEFEPHVDAFLVEGLSTLYDFKKGRVGPPDPRDQTIKLTELLPVAKHGKPVFNLLYNNGIDEKLKRKAIAETKTWQMSWYLTDVALNQVGLTECGKE